MIKNRLRGKMIILVLDDVNDLNQLQKLARKRDWFGRGSRIIITTRDKHLLETHLIDEIYEVKALKNEDALHLFCSKAFKNELVPDKYLKLSKGFLNYVAGHPLALIVFGSFLSKRSVVEWENEFEKLKEHPKLDVIRVLKISYNGLEGPKQELFKDIAFIKGAKDTIGLVELRLPRSKIELLWGGMKIFQNLRYINMDGSSDLIISPNFNGVQNLEELVLARCSNLRKLHPSIGKLKKLKLLDLKECQELTSLPDKFEMESLVTLNLTHCLKVKKIPEFVGNMELLQELLLEGTTIIELPSSCLPNTICSLTSLNNLDLFGCSKFDKLQEDLGNIVSLKKLCLSETAIKELPSSFEFLIGLTSLDLTYCKNFVLLSSTICSLKSLDEIILSRCSKFDKLPKDLGNIISLKKLNLSGTGIKELPSSVKFLIGLTSLNLIDCKKFVLLSSTICSFKSLDEIILSECSKFDKLPKDLGNIVSLKTLCLSRTAIKELPSSVEFLIGLETLFLEDCKKFVLLPSTVGSLKSLKKMWLSRCPKFVNLPENFESQTSELALS
nr:disease resistance protein TAO1-like [Quercus suber]